MLTLIMVVRIIIIRAEKAAEHNAVARFILAMLRCFCACVWNFVKVASEYARWLRKLAR